MKMITNQSAQNPGTLLGDLRSTKAPMRKTDADILQETAADLMERSEGTLPGEVLRLLNAGNSPEQVASFLNLDTAEVNSISDNYAKAVVEEHGSKMKKRHKKEFKNKKGWL